MQARISLLILSSLLLVVGFKTVLAQTPQEAAVVIENSESKIENQEATNNETKAPEPSLLSIDISDKIDIDNQLNNIETYYDDLSEKIGITNTTISALISSGITIAIFLLAKLILNLTTAKVEKSFTENKSRQPRGEPKRKTARRFEFYRSLFDALISSVLVLLFIEIILNQWRDKISFISDIHLTEIITIFASVLIITAIAIVVIESSNRFIDQLFERHRKPSARTDTIKPIAKNVVNGTLLFIFGMLTLSQMGIDIAPLLAGAGVVGIAIGFGAQALVKDILTGIIIILEDLIQVGDVVTLQDRTGVIEKITIRKVQMRNLDGTVYTVPFGEVDIVANLTKVFSYYLMNVGIAYRENVDEVRDVLKAVSDDMRSDDHYSHFILGDIEILGLDEFADSAVIIKARIKTLPKKQWDVGREFNRRLKFAFDEHGIEIPFPHQTLYIGQDKNGESPALAIDIQDKAV